MNTHGRTSWWRLFAGASSAVVLVSVFALDAEAQLPKASPAAETVPLQPSLVDFLTGVPVSATLQDLAKPKLLQKAFGGLPKEDPKGLASLIKAKEVDVANRVAAAKYLGKVDCQQFPESQLALADLLVDEFEPVRFEAAKALHTQFGRGPSDSWLASFSSSKRKDACRGCCNTPEIQKIVNLMHKQACEYDEYGCPNEPSERVREILAEAIDLCVHCNCNEQTATYAEPLEPTAEPDVTPETGESGVSATPTELPAAPAELPAAPAELPAAPAELPAAPAEAGSTKASENLDNESADRLLVPAPTSREVSISTISYESDGLERLGFLEGNCPVERAENYVRVPASAEFETVYQGVLGQYAVGFSSANAMKKFINNPAKYVPEMDGYCVTTWSRTGMKVPGRFIAVYDGQAYCFANSSLAEEFSSNPSPTLKLMTTRLSKIQTNGGK